MIIIHGAFDRHNYGDLLFPLVLARTLPKPLAAEDVVFTGNVPSGEVGRAEGIGTVSLWELLEGVDEPVLLVHAGGEVLTACKSSVGPALLDRDHAQAVSRLFGARALAIRYSSLLRRAPVAPYVVDAIRLPRGSATVFNAVGGVSLARQPGPLRQYVLGAIQSSALVAVRDHETARQLQDARPDVRLVPDTATVFPSAYADEIDRAFAAFERKWGHLRRGRYIVLQFNASAASSANFVQFLRAVAVEAGEKELDVVVCNMGNAAFHDDIEASRQVLQDEMPDAALYTDGDLWVLSGLIKNAALWIGTSLHGRIVAIACGTPRLSVLDSEGKLAAYIETWDSGHGSAVTLDGPDTYAEVKRALAHALGDEVARLESTARELTALVYEWLDALWLGGLINDEWEGSSRYLGPRHVAGSPVARKVARAWDLVSVGAWNSAVHVASRAPARWGEWWSGLRRAQLPRGGRGGSI